MENKYLLLWVIYNSAAILGVIFLGALVLGLFSFIIKNQIEVMIHASGEQSGSNMGRFCLKQFCENAANHGIVLYFKCIIVIQYENFGLPV